MGRPSIPPEMLLRAMLLQAFYSIRSERLLMERLEFDLLFRWFVGLGIDDAGWDHSTFSKNRDRLLQGEIAAKFLAAVLAQPKVKRLLSTDHFSVDGALIEAWASMKSFKPKAANGADPPGDDPSLAAPSPPASGGRNAEVDFRGQKRSNEAHESTTDPGARLYRKIRKRIEEGFGWIKTVGGQRKTKFKGRDRVGWAFTFTAAAYNLVRLPKPLEAAA